MLAIEGQLMVKIPHFFSMESITKKLTVQEQQELVAESADMAEKRSQLVTTLGELNNGKKLCKRWERENKSPQNRVSYNPNLLLLAGKRPDLVLNSEMTETELLTGVDVGKVEEEL